MRGAGWAGSALCRGIVDTVDLELVAALARKDAGKTLGDALGIQGLSAPVFADVEDALKCNPDVFVEYTKPDVAKSHILSALKHGAHVVVGTSGLSTEEYAEIDAVAKEVNRGVLAVGNFALTVVLLQKFAEMAAKYIPHWEIIDYAHADKKDAPSGTARELANRLSKIQEAKLEVPLDQVVGPKESRGARLQGTQVHSVPAGLCHFNRCNLWHAGAEADSSTRVGGKCRALRRWCASCHSRSEQFGGCASRAG